MKSYSHHMVKVQLVTRISGEGNPGKFLDIDSTMYDLIFSNQHKGKDIVQKSGAGPIDAKVVDPLRIKDGKYRLEISAELLIMPERIVHMMIKQSGN
jgi:hypothetical protein